MFKMVNQLKLCRLCGSLLDEDDHDPGEESNKSEACYDMLKHLLNVEILHNEKLPNKVCENCFHQLDSFCMFKENFFRTQSSLELVLGKKCFTLVPTGITASKNNEGEVELDMTVTDDTKNPTDDQDNREIVSLDRCETTNENPSPVANQNQPPVANRNPGLIANQNPGPKINQNLVLILNQNPGPIINQNPVPILNQNPGPIANQVALMIPPFTFCVDNSNTNRSNLIPICPSTNTTNLIPIRPNTNPIPKPSRPDKFIVEMIPIQPSPEETDPVNLDDSDDEDRFNAVVNGSLDPLRLSPKIKTEEGTSHPDQGFDARLPTIKMELDEPVFSHENQPESFCVDVRIKKELENSTAGTHTDEDCRFVCSLCGASLSSKYHLQRHMTTHSDARPFKCRLCPLTFKRNDKLKDHVRTHRSKIWTVDEYEPNAETSRRIHSNLFESSPGRIQPLRKFSRRFYGTLQPLPGCKTNFSKEFQTMKLSDEHRKILEESQNLKVAMTPVTLSWTPEKNRGRLTDEDERGNHEELEHQNPSWSDSTRQDSDANSGNQNSTANANVTNDNTAFKVEGNAPKKRTYKHSGAWLKKQQAIKMRKERMKSLWNDPERRLEQIRRVRESYQRRECEKNSVERQDSDANRTPSTISLEIDEDQNTTPNSGDQNATANGTTDNTTAFEVEANAPKKRSYKHSEAWLKKQQDSERKKKQYAAHSAKMKSFWKDPVKRLEQIRRQREAIQRRKSGIPSKKRQKKSTNESGMNLESEKGKDQDQETNEQSKKNCEEENSYWFKGEPLSKEKREQMSSNIKAWWIGGRSDKRSAHSARMRQKKRRLELMKSRQEASLTPLEELEMNENEETVNEIIEKERHNSINKPTNGWRAPYSYKNNQLSEKRKRKLTAKGKSWWDELDKMENSAKLRDFYRWRKLEKKLETEGKPHKLKAYWSDPRRSMEHSNKLREACQNRNNERRHKERRPDHSARMKSYWSDPKKRVEQSQRIRKFWQRNKLEIKLEKNAKERQCGTDMTENRCDTVVNLNIESGNSNWENEIKQKEKQRRQKAEKMREYWRKKREEKARQSGTDMTENRRDIDVNLNIESENSSRENKIQQKEDIKRKKVEKIRLYWKIRENKKQEKRSRGEKLQEYWRRRREEKALKRIESTQIEQEEIVEKEKVDGDDKIVEEEKNAEKGKFVAEENNEKTIVVEKNEKIVEEKIAEKSLPSPIDVDRAQLLEYIEFLED